MPDPLQIKRYDGTVIATAANGETLAQLASRCRLDLRGANLRGAYLGGAGLRDACLRGAYLGGAYLVHADLWEADLRDAYLWGAYLMGAYLWGASLRGADLRDAYLMGANLRDASLRGATLAWDSRDLLAEILRQAAGDDVQRRSLAGLVIVSRDWCWDDFLTLDHPEREWALDVLAGYVQDGDHAPEVLRQRAARGAGGDDA